MNKYLLSGIVLSSAMVLGVSGAWMGNTNVAPDGLQPPAGPVTDTQPSLTTISEQISELQAANGVFPPNLQFRKGSAGGNQQTETVEFVSATEADFVRVYSVFVTSATTNMLVGTGEETVAVIGGSAVLSSGQVVGSSQFNFGGLRVPTPVKFRTGGQDSGSKITLLYWIEN